jgi:Uma2 family endonuclease
VENRVLLTGVSWKTYESLLDDYSTRSSVRFTYDHGRLQIMSPLPEHENYGAVVGQLVRVLATESGIKYRSFGSTTYRREDLERGLEPDDCFYLASLPRILGLRTLDLRHDPVPDLALEMDVTRSSIDRLTIYAALGVPEVWRFDGTRVTCYHLTASGNYEERDFSPTFPFLRVDDLTPFVLQVFDTDEGSLLEAFRVWVRTRISAGQQSPPPPQP